MISSDMKMGNSRISIKNVCVSYDSKGIRDDLQSLIFNGIKFSRQNGNQKHVLRSLNLECFEGDVIGIVGNNGAGKSTLCKLLSGIIKPDVGSCTVKGSVATIMSLSAGFNVELTGRENIELKWMLLGGNRVTLNEEIEKIIEFSGLRRFIDDPIKTYSSGMKARLGFSVVSAIEPDVLILDEALNAGDFVFNHRASLKIQELRKKAKLVIVVTHNMRFVLDNCNKAIWLDDGMLMRFGSPEDVVVEYVKQNPGMKIGAKPQIPKLQVRVPENELIDKCKIYARNPEVKFDNWAFDGAIGVNDLAITFNRKSISNKKKESKIFYALNGVNLEINEGEIVGVVGQNGSGKSTLCKVFNRILEPDRGLLKIKGETSALLSIGSGFDLQLNGIDNIYLNGMMLGISKQQLRSKLDEIIDFSELGDAINKPIKTYSSGMKARLGFSILSAVEPEILILDEALSAGDGAFREKASARILELIKSSKAVVIVTHNLSFVEKVCNRGIVLHQGKILFDGAPTEAVESYRQTLRGIYL